MDQNTLPTIIGSGVSPTFRVIPIVDDNTTLRKYFQKNVSDIAAYVQVAQRIGFTEAMVSPWKTGKANADTKLGWDQDYPLRQNLPLFLTASGSVKEDVTNKQYCLTYQASLPLAGSIQVCGPQSTKHYSFIQDQLQVDNQVNYASGVIHPEIALNAAYTLARQPYTSRVAWPQPPTTDEIKNLTDPCKKTYLGSSLTMWHYNTKDNAWIFGISISNEGGYGSSEHSGSNVRIITPNCSDLFRELVWIRVDNTGKACLTVAQPYEKSTDANGEIRWRQPSEPEVFVCSK